VSSVTLRLRLVPRAFVPKGDGLEGQVSVSLPLLSCPATVVSGAAVRDVDEPNVVVRLDPSCGKDPRLLRWTVNGEPADPRKTVKGSDGVYVLLHASRIASDRANVTATRPELEGTVVASASGPTTPAPQPRVALELREHGKIDFVPTNRPAQVFVSGATQQARAAAGRGRLRRVRARRRDLSARGRERGRVRVAAVRVPVADAPW
jgi:hypothetical protein